MRYDSSLYRTGAAFSFNPINASSAYFPDMTETYAPPSGVPGYSGEMAGVMNSNGNNGAMVDDGDGRPMAARGVMGKPAGWWITLVLVFAVMVFVSRRFGGAEKYGNMRVSLWNLAIATIFMVIMLNFLKVTFSFFKVPGLSTLVAAA